MVSYMVGWAAIVLGDRLESQGPDMPEESHKSLVLRHIQVEEVWHRRSLSVMRFRCLFVSKAMETNTVTS